MKLPGWQPCIIMTFMATLTVLLLHPASVAEGDGHLVGVYSGISHMMMKGAWHANQTSTSRDQQQQEQQHLMTSCSSSSSSSSSSASVHHPYLNVMPSSIPSGPSPEECIPLPQTSKNITLCLHQLSYLSRVLKSGQLYESDFLHSMTAALTSDPGMVLLDIGANLGLYTVWAARDHRDVIAVDMLPENLNLLRHSLAKNRLSGFVTIINNALSDTHAVLQPTFIKSKNGNVNIGETMLKNALLDKKLDQVDTEKKRIEVKSICMDDLIPFVGSRPVFVKMDIEGSEHKALQCAHQLFNSANIRIVQMEWRQRSLEEITQITDFMTGHGYVPSLKWNAVEDVDVSVDTVPGFNVYFLRKIDNLGVRTPTIYLITPTYRRSAQKADLTRLVYTFRQVPGLHWIVVEDSDNRTDIVTNLLKTCGISYTHLNVSSPKDGKRVSTLMKGVLQRNAGLEWIRENTAAGKDGVVYFADDDNTYDIRLFDRMRYTRRVSVWPVGLIGQGVFENIKMENGKVSGFHVLFKPSRPFAVDMAGFSVNTRLIHENPSAKFYFTTPFVQESDFIVSLNVSLSDLEPVTKDFNQVLVWHTKTENKMNLKYPSGPKLEVR